MDEAKNSGYWAVIRQNANKDWQKAKATFAESWQLARGKAVDAEGALIARRPMPFVVKGSGTALGCFLTGAGVYQLIKAPGDQVPDNDGKTHMNYTRMYVGGMMMFLGALGAYVAASSGIPKAR